MEQIVRENFKKLRKKIKITQEQMAEYLNLEQSSISKFESGERTISVSNLEKACSLFGIPLKDIYKKTNTLDALSPSFRKVNISLESLEDIANINKIAMNIIEMNMILDSNEHHNDNPDIEKQIVDRLLLQRRASNVREALGVDSNSPIDLFSLVSASSDITLVFYPFNEEISGVCMKQAKLIAINSTSTVGRQAFSIAHELYHYFYDGDKTAISYRNINDSSLIEKEANLFASYLLMPDSLFTRLYNKLTNNGKKKIELLDILEIEQYFKVSRNAVLVRLILEGYLNNEESEQYKKDIVKNAKKNGYEIKLYFKRDNDEPKTYGSYLKKALKLKDLGLISDGKYEEYLLDAYRNDIVFGDNEEEDIYD